MSDAEAILFCLQLMPSRGLRGAREIGPLQIKVDANFPSSHVSQNAFSIENEEGGQNSHEVQTMILEFSLIFECYLRHQAVAEFRTKVGK